MTDRRWIVLPVALGLLLLAGVGYWGNQQYTMRQNMEVALNNKYHMAFYDLVENVKNLEVLLSKTLVGQESDMDMVFLMDIWERANAARADLGQLPAPDALMARTTKFLTQTGDFSHSLMRKMSGGREKSEEDWQTLNTLYKQAAALNTELVDVEAEISDGRLYMNELTRESRQALRREGPKLADGNLQAIDKQMQGFPTLIYDGPFSDHLEKREPRGVTGERINTAQARSKAMEFLDSGEGVNYVVQTVATQKGNLPAYRVEINSRPLRAGESVSVALSRQGGHVIWMTNARNIGDATLNIEQAVERADKFLAQRGHSNMVNTYYERQSNMAVINYAATQEDVVLYPDLIKVSVALDNGQVVGYEASNYLMSHHRRNLPAPKLTVEQARKKLSPKLEEVSQGRLALIPTGIERETLAYEFQGRLNNDTFLIYINALDGREEQVLRVVRNNEGILTL